MRDEAMRWRFTGGRLTRDLHALSAQAERQRRPDRRWLLKGVLSALVLVAVLGYLLWDKVDVSTLLETLRAADLRWLAAAAVLVVANRVVMALKWWLILRGEGLRLGLFYLVMVTFVGYFVGRLMPGALGMEVVRVWYLARDHGIGTVGLASVVIDRSTSLGALALVALLALLSFDIPFPGREAIIAACIAVLAAFVLLTVFAPAVTGWLSRIESAAGTTRLRRGLERLRRIAVAMSSMQGRHGVVLQSLTVGVAAQLIRGFGIYFIFVALQQPWLLAESLAVAPILMFVTMVPLGVSSIAVAAGAMVLLLEPAGVPPAVSLSASLLSDALLLLLIPIGALCFAASGYWRKGAAEPA